jgi:branched-chain amino acid transport system ATP-binding protein
MAADTPLLETRMLCRSFGGLRAVRDVSLTLCAGELHAVIGPNGAGKSTLTNLLSGELAPTSGAVLFAGVDISAVPVHARVHLGIARSFQRTNILADLTARENVRLAAQAIHGGGRRVIEASARAHDLVARAEAALARVGLDWAVQRAARTLSHGAQRQLEIAMALATDPKVILLDEPLAGMGQEEGARMALLLRDLAREHAVLLIEHDMDFVFQVADRMTVMVDGGVLASGPPAEIRGNAAVQSAYLGGHA